MNSSFLFIFLLIGHIKSSTVDCKFDYYTKWNIMGEVYTCLVQSINEITSREDAVITGATGKHYWFPIGYGNSDVKVFSLEHELIKYFPRGIKKIFNNVEGIRIEWSQLQEIQQGDLKPFSSLRLLDLSNNNLKYLERYLFYYNANLEYIGLSNNHFIHIDEGTFSATQKLTWLYLGSDYCVNRHAEGSRKDVIWINDQLTYWCKGDQYAPIGRNIVADLNENLKEIRKDLNDLESRLEPQLRKISEMVEKILSIEDGSKQCISKNRHATDETEYEYEY